MDKIYVMSDIHGNFKYIRDFYKRNKDNSEFAKANKFLILLGDTGANYFFNYRDTEFKKTLCKFPFTYFLIRGNHEERPSLCIARFPEKWHKEDFWGNTVYVENEFPQIKYALDCVSTYRIPQENSNGYPYFATAIIPGAYSVDKWYRLSKEYSWFPQEQLSKDEMEIGLKLLGREYSFYDLILSHTCSIDYEPTDLFLSQVDQDSVDKTTEKYIKKIESTFPFKATLFGHYHEFRNYPFDNNHYRTMIYNDRALDLYEYMKGILVLL